jgi:hypothetical protein
MKLSLHLIVLCLVATFTGCVSIRRDEPATTTRTVTTTPVTTTVERVSY